jgi:hypothetical protein
LGVVVRVFGSSSQKVSLLASYLLPVFSLMHSAFLPMYLTGFVYILVAGMR